ncbi:MAG: tRNA guanosine(34) transglycosylase Tgt, partial [Patescibacteria group bacterium]
MRFKILKKSKKSRARRGVIETPHGYIETPAFVPVGTQATVKGVTVAQLKEIGAQSVLCNTYHLYLRPGDKTVKQLGGLHGFMSWDRPIWTDSGGFQVFSLGYALEHGVGKIASMFPEEKGGVLHGETEHVVKKDKLTKVTEDGVEFRSHLDGSKHFFTPEKSIQIQQNLGADLIFAFDECTSPLHDYKYTKRSMERTHRWAKRCLKEKSDKRQGLYGIIQGGIFRDLREQSAKFISSLNFDGIGIGGALGKTKKEMHKILGWIAPLLPEEKPRHLLGIGSAEDIIEAVKNGMDTFDCVAPTRNARNGEAILKKASLNLNSGRYLNDKNPINKECLCY